MTNQHPITPPLELVHQWVDMLSSRSDHHVFSLASQWGADQELEACCKWMKGSQTPFLPNQAVDFLRADRRPKQLSLKEEALESVKRFESGQDLMGDLDTIRQALEQLT